MSVETLTIVISAIGIVVALGTSMFAGACWIVRRIDGVEERLTARIDVVAGETTALKIAVARLEGPPRHLCVSSR